MIKKDLKLFVNVGENSLALRKLMAEHLESMGIDGDMARWSGRGVSRLTINENGLDFWVSSAQTDLSGYKEITAAEFFNLTESDLKEPVRKHCEFSEAYYGTRQADLTQDQINRVLAIFNESES